MTRCYACGEEDLVPFADLGTIPVFCGVHWASRDEALASPLGRMELSYCPSCAYVRNVAFDPSLLYYDTTMDTNLHHSPAFQSFSAELVKHLSNRYPLRGATVLDIGCGQGEFLRELCHISGARGFGYDAMYAGPLGLDESGATFYSGHAPLDETTPPFDFVTSRHWFEHIDDPFAFLSALRSLAGDRPVRGYIEVPDACYDMATAGWEVIYPHVSYFDAFSLRRIVERAGWRVEDTGPLFSGMFRFIEFSANVTEPTASDEPLPGGEAIDRQLTSIAGFASRHFEERNRWRTLIAERIAEGDKPVLWGAGSRGVQFLHLADPDGKLAAVVDVNSRKWGRFLPVTGHEVTAPSTLAGLGTHTVIITNPAYSNEIGSALRDLGVDAELLVA